MRFSLFPAISILFTAACTIGCGGSHASSGGQNATGGANPGGGGGGAVEGRDISSQPDQDRESEMSIAYDPGTNVMIATWYDADLTDQRQRRVVWRRSTDMGQTWSVQQTLQGTTGFIRNNRAKVVADSKGDFYITWMEMNDPPVSGAPHYALHIFMAKMESGGTDFGAPVEVSDPTQENVAGDGDADAPMVAVDAQDHILVTWPANGAVNGAMFAKSTDFGNTFSTPTLATSTPLNPLICVDRKDAAGPIFIVQSDGSQRAPGLVVSQSTDGGKTFAKVGSAPGVGDPFNASCVVRGKTLRILVHATDAQGREQVNLLTSDDGGHSFAHTAIVAPAADGTSFQQIAQFDVADNGSIVSTYASIPLGADAQTQSGPAHLMMAVSHDAGQTFTRTSIGTIGEMLNTPEDGAQDIPLFVGTFFALMIYKTDAFVGYCDNTSGHSHVKFERIAIQ